ncbi:MAG: hypothetical protein AAGC78_06755 [Cellvibrio sp.]|uniref:hypothetical protein n=1 Tax=Cellvibrio sp. TaxID=1965322 RepID=UPI0031A92EFC
MMGSERVDERRAQKLLKSQSWVIASTEWILDSELLKLARFESSSELTEWKSKKKLFSVIYEGVEYYPLYAFEVESKFRPIESLAAILKELGTAKNDWGIAYWFSSPNGFLGGFAAQCLLKTEPGKVLEAAKDELLGIQHG